MSTASSRTSAGSASRTSSKRTSMQTSRLAPGNWPNAPARNCGCRRTDAGELYEVAFPHHPMHDAEALTLGNVRIEARHTPGHTPEHLAFLGFELARAPTTPAVMLSGDFLFVGSLGRPDLIGEHAKVALANALYNSVTQVLPSLPDGLEIHPAHGAGSMCGSGMSARPMSTLGFERVANPYLRAGLGRDAFVAEILGARAAVSAVLQADEAAQRAWPGDIGSSTWPEADRRTRLPDARRQRIRRRRRARPVVVRRRPHPGGLWRRHLGQSVDVGRLGRAVRDTTPDRLRPSG